MLSGLPSDDVDAGLGDRARVVAQGAPGHGALRRRHDVVALHLQDPREKEVMPAGLVAFTDPEATATYGVTSDSVAQPVLRHRITLSYEANADGVSANAVLDELLKHVAVA